MKVIQWILINFLTLGAFLYGEFYNHEGFSSIGVFIFWITSVMGLFMLSEETAKKQLEKDYDYNFSVYYPIDLLFDLVVLFFMAYFNYIFLTAFYFIGILGQKVFRENIKKLKGNQCSDT
jgi:hypothetical protein